MGFFSWKTMDTNRSISNQFSDHSTFPVVMIDNKGNKWLENDYEGYGVFGGKDYYELLAQMNGKTTREEGIDLEFHSQEFDVIFPNLVELESSYDWKWIDEKPENCPDQGYFYHYDEDEEIWEEEF